MADDVKPIVPPVDLDQEKSGISASGSDQPLLPEDDPKLDRRILWRRDLFLVPTMGILYMLLFLDRTNIANARALGIGSPTGLEGALNMPSNGYNIALSIFYIPFVLAEVPANLILNSNKIRPGLLLGGQMCVLGILGMCQGLTRSYGSLLAIRFLMGIFEISLPAGGTYMISLYYTKREAAVRLAWFFNFALVGPLFAGVLAFAIQNIDGAGGYQGWRWVLIIEGLMTVAVSVPVMLLCPNFPHQAQRWFLKPNERERLIASLEASRGAEVKGSVADSVPIWKILVDWRIHLFTMCFFCCDISASSIASFTPTILTELGWTNTVAQLMTMPVWATGIVGSFFIAWISLRLNFRTPVLLACICSQLVGWIIMVVYVSAAGIRYMALFFIAAGTFPQMPTLMAWLSANLRGRKYLAVGTAWKFDTEFAVVGFGNCANLISSNVFIKEQAPRYRTGFTSGLVFTIAGFLITSLGCALLVLKNRKREAIREKLTESERKAYDELHFKFVL